MLLDAPQLAPGEGEVWSQWVDLPLLPVMLGPRGACLGPEAGLSVWLAWPEELPWLLEQAMLGLKGCCQPFAW